MTRTNGVPAATVVFEWGILLSLACVPSDISQQREPTQTDATPTAFPQVAIEDSERRELASDFVADVFKIHVYFPRGYAEMMDFLPVVYLLDAEYSFGAVAYAIRRMVKDSLIPPVLLVGVAYEVPYDEYYRRRERDFTPTAAHLDEFPNAGHAASFAQFLSQELVPFINRTYRVDPDDRTIMGLSFSGLFSSYLLFTESDLFNRYVIVSPSLWWDDGVVFRYESDRWIRSKTLPARIFLAAGEQDGSAILRDLQRMQEVLAARSYEGLQYRVRLFPDETHRTVFPLAVSHGLRFVFAGGG
jgi:predicted alpha/beta superfamily hydrolase